MPNYKKKFKVNSIALKVFEVLEDEEWHCRGHEYKNTGCTQLAGSGGIKGLKDGNGDRPGIEIKSGNNFCVECNKTTRQDIWSGQFIIQSSSSSISKELQLKILRQYMYKDIVEQTIRPANHLTIDHRFPKLRWSDTYAEKDKTDMSANEINARFQLLKKSNGSASHNHLKSRACEKCSRDKKRGTPFGIKFYYEGDETWQGMSDTDERGCHGCGWYNFDKWRKALNKFIIDKKE